MSYLQFPRLIFSGRFQADPSTVNNNPHHFKTDEFQPNYEVSQSAGHDNGWWNPLGTGAFRLRDCKVQQVQYKDGSSCADSAKDSVIGKSIISINSQVAGKIVDLDSEQQSASQLWGLQVFIGEKGAWEDKNGEPILIGGDYEVGAFSDLWFDRNQGKTNDMAASAFYQSVIQMAHSLVEVNTEASRFLQEVQGCLGQGNRLSIKFTVDKYNAKAENPEFSFGRIVGAIGVYREGDPGRFLSSRQIPVRSGAKFHVAPGNSKLHLNNAYTVIDDGYVHLDLGNSLQTNKDGSPFDIGKLSLAILTDDKNPKVIQEVAYQQHQWLETTAGIVSFSLTNEQAKLAANSPLALIQNTRGSASNPVLAAEPADGEFIRADQIVFRFNAGDKFTGHLYATKFGKPLTEATVSFHFDSMAMAQQQNQGPIPGPTPGTPNPDTGKYPIAFPGAKQIGNDENAFFQIKTDSNGIGLLEMEASAPGNPRKYIDGQVFGITFQLGDNPPAKQMADANINSSRQISALVFNDTKVCSPENKPTWLGDIQPILKQYADLYPIMKKILDLGNFGDVVRHRNILYNVFTSDERNPNYMPVTRDLSLSKRKMIVDWLAAEEPLYFDHDDPEQLKKALQLAVVLEHATIPTYLTAMYSLKPGSNHEVRGLIRSVVIEEMLHMSLACNLLVSIGGKPQIGKAGFTPTYPGSLPGGLRPNLTVTLKKASIAQIRDVFMSIELPDHELQNIIRAYSSPMAGHAGPGHKGALRSKIGIVDEVDDSVSTKYQYNQFNGFSELKGKKAWQENHRYTIAWFYEQILKSLKKLSESGAIAFGHPDQQVTEWYGTGNLIKIGSLKDAESAIHTILDQGEGAGNSPFDDDGELSHYYKFSEIVEGRKLIKVGEVPIVGDLENEDINNIGLEGYEMDKVVTSVVSSNSSKPTKKEFFAYAGPRIPFDPEQVWPMIDNPSLFWYPKGSKAEILSNQFTESYQAMLDSLHETFNGNPANLRNSIGAMFSIGLIASQLMETSSGLEEGKTAGPKFKLQE